MNWWRRLFGGSTNDVGEQSKSTPATQATPKASTVEARASAPAHTPVGTSDGEPTTVTLEGGGKVLSLELPQFVRGVERGTRVKMSLDSGDYWHLFETDETDDRYNDQGGIEIGLVSDDISPSRWYDIRRRYGKDVIGQSPGSFCCPLGEAHFIVRGGYAKGSEGSGFLVPEWLTYDIYIPDAVGGFSVKITFTGSRELFRQDRRDAVNAMVQSMKL